MNRWVSTGEPARSTPETDSQAECVGSQLGRLANEFEPGITISTRPLIDHRENYLSVDRRGPVFSGRLAAAPELDAQLPQLRLGNGRRGTGERVRARRSLRKGNYVADRIDAV